MACHEISRYTHCWGPRSVYVVSACREKHHWFQSSYLFGSCGNLRSRRLFSSLILSDLTGLFISYGRPWRYDPNSWLPILVLASGNSTSNDLPPNKHATHVIIVRASQHRDRYSPSHQPITRSGTGKTANALPFI